MTVHHCSALRGWPVAGLLRRVVDIPDKEVAGDEASQLRRATAFNFPAILASAGREQWPLLQPAHQALLQAADPAVRKTLACSLHEVARLLGPEQALQDLGSTIQVSIRHPSCRPPWIFMVPCFVCVLCDTHTKRGTTTTAGCVVSVIPPCSWRTQEHASVGCQQRRL